MKNDIHPKYFANAVAICGCGKKYTLGSTVEKIEVEICANCHPFFTGKEKLIDTAGKVEKFKARRAAVGSIVKTEKKPRKSNKKA
jgi:large subunit ribosomal protein L31